MCQLRLVGKSRESETSKAAAMRNMYNQIRWHIDQVCYNVPKLLVGQHVAAYLVEKLV